MTGFEIGNEFNIWVQIDIATIWSLEQKSYVRLAEREARGGPEDLRTGGDMFKLPAETIIGMTPVALDRPSDDHDLHAFAGEDAQVLVINGRSDSVQTVRIDMRALLGATGEAELSITGTARADVIDGGLHDDVIFGGGGSLSLAGVRVGDLDEENLLLE